MNLKLTAIYVQDTMVYLIYQQIIEKTLTFLLYIGLIQIYTGMMKKEMI